MKCSDVKLKKINIGYKKILEIFFLNPFFLGVILSKAGKCLSAEAIQNVNEEDLKDEKDKRNTLQCKM